MTQAVLNLRSFAKYLLGSQHTAVWRRAKVRRQIKKKNTQRNPRKHFNDQDLESCTWSI